MSARRDAYLAALDELVVAVVKVDATFPVFGEGHEYPPTFPSFDDVVCEVRAWRDAEKSSGDEWCDDCGALVYPDGHRECDARCIRVDGRPQ